MVLVLAVVGTGRGGKREEEIKKVQMGKGKVQGGKGEGEG